jgi:hypothetical protein
VHLPAAFTVRAVPDAVQTVDGVAVNVTERPDDDVAARASGDCATVSDVGGLKVIVCDDFSTVVVDVAVKPPSVVVTVIVAVPGPTAVTTPLVLTDAMDAFDEAHVTAEVVALLGAIAAVRVCVWPTFNVIEVGEMVTPVTGTVVVPPPSKAPALMMPTPHDFAGSGSQTPPGNGVNIPDVLMRVSICAGLSEEFWEIMSATTPETWGVAMLVPLYEAYEGPLGVVEPLSSVDQIPTPGAAISTIAP